MGHLSRVLIRFCRKISYPGLADCEPVRPLLFLASGMKTSKTALILSVGYGAGHHAAAGAVAEELRSRGWNTRVEDPCLLAHPHIFSWTQWFYNFCVRRAPWLWAVTYAQTDTADWSAKAHAPVFQGVTDVVSALVQEEMPDVIICTYPLYAHMLDALAAEGKLAVPYAVVVTDSLEISRPWMVNQAPLICLPDNYSLQRVSERYALMPQRLVSTGFPVRRAFAALGASRKLPTCDNLRLVYGAYASMTRVRQDLTALVAAYPEAYLTVIAGKRKDELEEFASSRVTLIERSDDMPSLFASAHFYIGKAGAATVFEAYASRLPVIVNYTLPGQEQGNLELLLLDGAGVTARTAADLVAQINKLLRNGAAGWRRMQAAMEDSGREGGAARIVDALESKFIYQCNEENDASYR